MSDVKKMRKAINKNWSREPLGEQLRAGLIEWITRNGIVSISLDTEEHHVYISSIKLPPEIKPVLTHYGSIYVLNQPPSVSGERRGETKIEQITGEITNLILVDEGWTDLKIEAILRAALGSLPAQPNMREMTSAERDNLSSFNKAKYSKLSSLSSPALGYYCTTHGITEEMCECRDKQLKQQLMADLRKVEAEEDTSLPNEENK